MRTYCCVLGAKQNAPFTTVQARARPHCLLRSAARKTRWRRGARTFARVARPWKARLAIDPHDTAGMYLDPARFGIAVAAGWDTFDCRASFGDTLILRRAALYCSGNSNPYCV